MYRVRRWVTTRSAMFDRVYQIFESALILLHPLFRIIGYRRLDKPVAIIEKGVKGFLFDTQMCGMCTLSSTGMACPMNCPKQLRNGPCGGVRADGNCEVEPDMHCVWIDIINGARSMQDQDRLNSIQPSVDHRLKGTSSWLREVRIKVSHNTEESGLL